MEPDPGPEDLESKFRDSQSKLKLVKTHLRKSLGECETLRAQLAEANANQHRLEVDILRLQTEEAERAQEQLLRQNQEIQQLRAQLAVASTPPKQEDKDTQAELQVLKDRSNQYMSLQQHVTKLEEKVAALVKDKIEIEKEKTAMVDKYCELSTELEERVAKYKTALIKSTQEVRSLHEDNERLTVKCDSLTNFVKEQISVESQRDAVALHVAPDAARVAQLTNELQQTRKELKEALEKGDPRTPQKSRQNSFVASTPQASTTATSSNTSSWGIFNIFAPKSTTTTTATTATTAESSESPESAPENTTDMPSSVLAPEPDTFSSSSSGGIELPSPSSFSPTATVLPSPPILHTISANVDEDDPQTVKLRESEQQLEAIRHRLSQREQQIKELLDTLGTVKQQKNVLFSDLQTAQTKVEQLSKDLEAAGRLKDEQQSSRQAAEGASNEMRQEVDRLYSTNSQLSRTNSTMQAELQAQQLKLEAATSHQADLQAQLQLLQSQHASNDEVKLRELKLELEKLTLAQSEWTKIERELAASLETMTSQWNSSVAQCREQEQQVARAEGELVACQHRLATAEGERFQLERELEVAKGRVQAGEEQIKLVQSVNQTLEQKWQEASATKEKETIKATQLEELRTELTTTKKALADTTELRMEGEKQRSLLENELSKMHSELEEAREEVKSLEKGVTTMCETEFKLRARLSELDPNYGTEDAVELPPETTSSLSQPLTASYNFSSPNSRAGPANASAGAPGIQGALACGCKGAAAEAQAKGEVIFSGMMEKRPFNKFSLSSGWRPRLFFLYANRLEYYSVEPKTKVCAYRGDIPFVAPIVLKRGRFESTYGLEISHPEGVFPLRCQSQASAVVWYEALVQVLKVKNVSGSFSFKSSVSSQSSTAKRHVTLFGGSLVDALDLNDKGATDASEVEAAVRARAISLGLPLIVSHCIDYLRREGLNVEGLFRVPGQAAAVQVLREQYEKGQVATLGTVHDVATLIKQYLASLPSSVIPFRLAKPLLEAVKAIREDHAEDRAEYAAIRDILNTMPDVNLRVLRHLLGLLYQLSENSNVNLMNAHNCATVFAPTLLREDEPASNAPGAGARMLDFMSATTGCVRVLITRYPLIFHRESHASPSVSRVMPSPPSSPSLSARRASASSTSEAQQGVAEAQQGVAEAQQGMTWAPLPSLDTK